MYKVMIVEDEMLVRIGLKNSVDWHAYGMELVADFPDGQAAWDYYHREKPDVVITDIRMPRMDGMELITNIRKADKDTRLVVLTCLEEFELARKAMSLGVSSYILKLTMTEEEIGQVLTGIREELSRQEGRVLKQSGQSERPNHASMDLIKEKTFKDFLFYNIVTPQEFGQFAERNGLRLSPARLVVCVMEVDRYARLRDKFHDNHGHLIKMTLLNILSEITTTFKRGEAFSLDETRYALLFHFEDMLSEQSIVQETHMILSRIQEVNQTYFNGSVSFGISGIRNGYESLPKLYGEAQRALERKFVTGPGQHHKGDQTPDASGVRARLDGIRRMTLMRELLPHHRRKEYDGYVDAIEREYMGDRKSVRTTLLRFVQWAGSVLESGEEEEQVPQLRITRDLEECDNLPDMLELAAVYLLSVSEQARDRLQLSGEITKAIQYIKQHYTDNINLQSVADHVGLSINYLSNLFKKELQISFIDYLNRYRIERAKELLAESNLKSYDIAVEVGFSPEYTYFSKVFKKVTGLNPNEYRRQALASIKGEP